MALASHAAFRAREDISMRQHQMWPSAGVTAEKRECFFSVMESPLVFRGGTKTLNPVLYWIVRGECTVLMAASSVSARHVIAHTIHRYSTGMNIKDITEIHSLAT